MSSTSNRRQPTRSVRTSIARPANYYARPFSYKGVNSALGGDDSSADSIAPGFFPAITYFTDAVDALPKEVVRHFTLLKETEGKAYQPELALADVVQSIRNLPPPDLRSSANAQTQGMMAISLHNSVNGSAHGSVVDGQGPRADAGDASSQAAEQAATRQGLFESFNVRLRDMIMVLEEKQSILHQASDTLERQIFRLEDVMPHIETELSEDARLGSYTHWALPHMKELRRPNINTERARRDVQATNSLAAAAAHVHENDITATRSEARREALMAKRGRHHNIDSDFDERPPKKQASANKVRKEGNAEQKPVKRRRADKNAAGETQLAAALNGRLGADGQPEKPVKKKSRPAGTQATQRKRNTQQNSPSLANLSPTRGNFATTANKRDNSPAPAMAKVPSSRGRQNSAAGATTTTTKPTSSTSYNKAANGLGIRTPELKSIANSTGRTIDETRSNLKSVQEADGGEILVEEGGVQGGFVVNDPKDPSMKREDTEPAGADNNNNAEADTNNGKASRTGGRVPKTATPSQSDMTAGAQPMARSRSARGANAAASNTAPSSPRRTHKKTASRSIQYQEAIAAETRAVDAEEEEGLGEDGDDDNDETASNEPNYCICNRPSFGDMIACDNDACPTEWFHLECVGLTKPPSTKTKWYCEDCKQRMRQGNGSK